MADTPEQLMRSRYSAFVLGLGEYLVHSWHPAHLGGLTAAELSQTDTHWDGLEIIASQGGPQDETGMVEFKAWFLEGDKRHCLH
ncbi:MAG: YchJ family protein, partial [Aeromonas allosaccharophila]